MDEKEDKDRSVSPLPDKKNNGKPFKTMKSRVLSGAFWLFMEKGGLGFVEFAVAWVLARFFLSPSDYSTVGLISIFISFSNIFVQGGFNTAIIQRKELDDEDCSTVFWLSLGVSLLFYGLLFILSPYIAAYYERPVLTSILRVQSLTLIFGALCVVQTALLTRRMQFRSIFLRTGLATAASAVFGISAAVMGFGVWTIVIQTVSVSLIGCIVMWFSVDWRPSFKFNFAKLKDLFGFGSKILASNIINCAYSNALPVVMDKLYTKDTLGFYNKARTIPTKLGEAINATVSNVVFPSLSACQNDPTRIKELTRRFIVTSSFVMFAIMAGLIAVARPMILFVYTEKWAGSIVFMQFVCISYAFMPLNSANLQAIKAMGRSDIYLILEIVKNGIGIALLAASMFFTRNTEYSLYIVLAVQSFISILCVAINSFPNKKLMGYSFGQQIKDILPSLLLAVFMGAAVYSVTFLELSHLITLLIQLPLGIIIYFGAAYLLKFECLTYLTAALKELIRRKLKKPQNGEEKDGSADVNDSENAVVGSDGHYRRHGGK